MSTTPAFMPSNASSYACARESGRPIFYKRGERQVDGFLGRNGLERQALGVEANACDDRRVHKDWDENGHMNTSLAQLVVRGLAEVERIGPGCAGPVDPVRRRLAREFLADARGPSRDEGPWP